MSLLSPFFSLLLQPLFILYQIGQWLISKALSPSPPRPGQNFGRPKIAIIGAGITGVTAAAHCVGHGFEVVIFEAGSEESVGGIWSVSPQPRPIMPNPSIAEGSDC
jgi:hypothetical protein